MSAWCLSASDSLVLECEWQLVLERAAAHDEPHLEALDEGRRVRALEGGRVPVHVVHGTVFHVLGEDVHEGPRNGAPKHAHHLRALELLHPVRRMSGC